MTKKIVALILAVCLAASLCACGGGTNNNGQPAAQPSQAGPGGQTSPESSAGEPVYGGEIVVGITADLDASLDPHVSSSSAGTREVLFNIFEGLVKPDKDGNLIPAVAESYSVSDSADVFTFKLRDGVRFHNGKTVTAGDVVYSLTRAAGLDTGTPLVSDVAGISAVEATDDKTIVVTLSAPDTEFISHATVAIIPEDCDPATEVIGTGPFRFVSRSVQDNIIFEKFEDYWGEPAYLDKVTLKVIDNAETLVMSLRSGSVDMACRLESSQVAELPGLNIEEGSSNIVQALYLNNARAPFNDARVRQALCYALDKYKIIDLACDGHGTALGSSMFPAFGKYFMPELTDYYTEDIEKAKALLAEAGYPNGFEFSITVASNMTQHVDTAQAIVELLRQIGVKATINQVDWAAWYSDAYKDRNFDSTVVGLDAHGLAASDMLARFQSDNSKNFINFSSARYDETYAKAAATVDEAEQTALYKQCETILAEEAASVYIQDLASYVAMQSDVGGYVYYPLYVMDLSKVYRTK